MSDATHDEDDVAVQVSHSTKLNRYPAVFGAVAQIVEAAGTARPAILSYGSSSGEEAHTLSTRYFEGSPILGLDVSDEIIATARERYGEDANLRFEKSGVFQPEPQSFDLIFAMSVLCRWPDTQTMDDIADLFPFARFARQAAYLDTLLKPGGFLVIYNASYGFLRAPVSAGYDVVLHPRVTTAGFVRRFAPDGGFDEAAIGADCIYRKRDADDPADPRRLRLRDRNLRVIGTIERDSTVERR